MALLILEVLALIFWLSSWAILAALYATPSYYYDVDTYSSYWSWNYKRSLEKRITYDEYNGTFISALAFSVIILSVYP